MMDEYIPSPRQTPNKHRRMRDVSSFYPVDENKLLLEAVLKQQRDNSSGDAGRGRGRTMNMEGPAGDNSPTRQRLGWREDRGCPVCRWATTKSSASSASDEYDGDESDDTSGGDDPRQVPESSSITSDTGEEEEDDDNEEAEEGSSVEDGNEIACIEAVDDEIVKNVEDNQGEETDGDVTETDAPQLEKQAEQPGTIATIADVKERPPEREGFVTSGTPGKLLYGRHCLWYQSAAFVRPHGGN